MGVRYEKSFDDQYGNTYKLQILDDQYSGSVEEVELNYKQPFKLSQPEVGYDDLHIRTTFLNLNIKKSSEDIYDLVRGTSKGRFTVKIVKNGEKYYSGEIEPTLIKKDRDFGPTEFSIEASDLPQLKRTSPFYGGTGPPTVGNPNNKVSVLQVLDGIFDDLGINEFSTVVELQHAAADTSKNPLTQYGFWYSFYNKDGTYKDYSNFEVLKQIAKRFNLTVTWTPGNRYLVEEWTNKDDTEKTRYNYSVGGPNLQSKNTSYSQVVEVDDNTVNVKPSISHQTEKRAESISTVTRHRVKATNGKNSFLSSPSFKTFGGWTSKDDSNYLESEFGYDISRDAFKINNTPNNQGGDYLEIEDVGAELTNKKKITEAANVITIESVWMQKGNANEYDTTPRNLWMSSRSSTDGWNYNGDPAAHSFSVQFDSGVQLALMEYQINSEVRQEGERSIKLSEPSVISPNPVSDPNYSSGVTILPKGHNLTFPWATVELLEDYNAGDNRVQVDVTERSFVNDERNAWGINKPKDSKPLIPDTEYAYTGGWVETTYDEFLVFPAVDNGGDRTAFKSKLPTVKPNGDPISSKMQVQIRGNYMTTEAFTFKMDVRPSTQKTKYIAKEPDTNDQIGEFVEGEKDPKELDKGEMFIGTTPAPSKGSVIDISSGEIATNWGNGLVLEERTLADIMFRANQAPDKVTADVRTEEFGPHKALKLDGDVLLPTQFELNPVEGEYSGSFRKESGLDLDWDYTKESEDESDNEDDGSVGDGGNATIVKPDIDADVISEYLESEKDRLRLSGDLIEFDGASQFSEYLVSDDYDGSLPDSSGNVSDSGSAGFLVKDAYFDDDGNQTADSELIISNAEIRESLIVGTDLDTGSFIGTEIVLNSDLGATATPTEDLRLRGNRGAEPDSIVEWDESANRWNIGTTDSSLKAGPTNLKLDGASTGFSGSGTIIQNTKSWFSSLNIRDTLYASEFEVKKLKVSKGTRIFGPGGGKATEIVSQTDSEVTIRFEEPPGIQQGDLCLIKEVQPDGGAIAAEIRLQAGSTETLQDPIAPLRITSHTKANPVFQEQGQFTSAGSGGGSTASPQNITFTIIEKDREVRRGDDVVAVGHPTNNSRDSLLSANPFGPHFNVLDEIDSFSDWETRTPTARLGKLDGLPNITGESPTGHGLFSTNAYLKGTIFAEKGKIADSVEIGGTNAGSVGGGEIIRSDNEPTERNDGTDLQVGDMWIDTDDGDEVHTYNSNGNFVQAYTIIDGGDIETGSVTADQIDVTDLFAENITLNNGGSIESSNYSAGSSGFKIQSNGDVEFQDGVFRGTINATDGTIEGDLTVGDGNGNGSISNPNNDFIINEDGVTFTFGDNLNAGSEIAFEDSNGDTGGYHRMFDGLDKIYKIGTTNTTNTDLTIDSQNKFELSSVDRFWMNVPFIDLNARTSHPDSPPKDYARIYAYADGNDGTETILWRMQADGSKERLDYK